MNSDRSLSNFSTFFINSNLTVTGLYLTPNVLMFLFGHSSEISSTTSRGLPEDFTSDKKDGLLISVDKESLLWSLMEDDFDDLLSLATSTTYDLAMFSESVDAKFEETSVV